MDTLAAILEKEKQNPDTVSIRKVWDGAKVNARSWVFSRLMHLRKLVSYELDTIVHAMHILDRFVVRTPHDFESASRCTKTMYLYMSACVLIASKYNNESDHLSLSELVSFSGGRFVKQELVRAEAEVLQTVNYEIVIDTEVCVLHLIREALDIQFTETRRLMEFVCCLTFHSNEAADFSVARLAIGVAGLYLRYYVKREDLVSGLTRMTRSCTLDADISILVNVCKSLESRLRDKKDKELLYELIIAAELHNGAHHTFKVDSRQQPCVCAV